MTREELFKNLKAGARWDVGVSINRSNSLPLDANSIFESYTAAAAYASKDATRIAEYGFLNNAYIGQIIAVIEDKTVGEETVTTVGIYYIDANLTLQPVGKEVVADGNTIVNDNGTIKLYGFEAAGAATYPRKTADGKIEWVTVDQVVAGATKNTITIGDNVTIVTTGSVDDGYTASLKGSDTATNGQVPFYNVTETAEGSIKTLVWKDVYTKAEVDAKIAGLLTYKGTAHHVSDSLDYIFVSEGADGIKADPTNLGHVYIVGDKEYVSNGNKWEELGYTTEVDLSNYYTKSEADAVVKVEEDRAVAAENVLSGRLDALEKIDHDLYAKAADLAALEGTVTTLSGNLTTLQGTVNEEKGKITTLQNQFTDLDTTVSGQAQLITGLRTDVDAKVAKDTYDEYVEDRQLTDTEINELVAGVNVTDRVAALEGTVGNAESGLVKDVADNKNNITNLTTKIGTLESADSAILERVGALEATDQTQTADISSLKTSVGEHTTALAGLSGTVKSITDANAQTADAAKSAADAAKSAADAAQSTANDAVAGVNVNAGNITTLTGRVDTAEGKITTLEGNVTTINGRLDTAEGKITTLESQIGGLSGAMHFRGISSTDPMGEDGPTISGVESYATGDVVIYSGKEYVYDGSAWHLFGDEGSYALRDEVYTKQQIIDGIQVKTISIGEPADFTYEDPSKIGENISLDSGGITYEPYRISSHGYTRLQFVAGTSGTAVFKFDGNRLNEGTHTVAVLSDIASAMNEAKAYTDEALTWQNMEDNE